MDLLSLFAPIILEGLKVFREERRTRIEDEYHDILKALTRAKNKQGFYYSDSEIDRLNLKLKDFLKAYANQLKEHNDEINS